MGPYDSGYLFLAQEILSVILYFMKDFDKKADTLKKYNFWQGQAINYGHLRPTYLQSIVASLGNPLIKVILGQRRCGKSRLMRMLIDHLIREQRVPAKNILYINKELLAFDFIRNDLDVMEIINIYQTIQQPEGKIYFFLDEVQEITGWERVVNSLSQDYSLSIELFVSGSNAHLLSGEFATYLGGRCLTFTVYPFGYTEYCDVLFLEKGKASVLGYLQHGGLPETLALSQPDSKQNYVHSLLDSIVLRDIVQRHQVRDAYLLEKLLQFTVDSVGSMISIPSMVKTLVQLGYRSHGETIGNYLRYFQETFLLHECARYDLRSKQMLVGERKYYVNDLAFKLFNGSRFETHITRLLENAVYLSLLRQGYKIYVGRYGDQKVDFIAEKGQEKLYIQVAYLLADEQVIRREFGALMLIRDHYPKWVVTLDDMPHGNKEGILHKPLWEVLV